MTGLTIVSRRTAGLRDPSRPSRPPDLDRIRSVTVHWTGPSPGNRRNPGIDSTLRWCRAMQSWHMDHHHWSDLLYNYAVGRDGTVVAARGLHLCNYAEGRSSLADVHRYNGGGRAWPEIYGLHTPPRSFDALTLSVVAQIGQLRSGDAEPPPKAMVAALQQLVAHLSATLGRNLYVDVHRAHRIKPCPGPHLSHLAEAGVLGRAAAEADYTTKDEAVALALEYLATRSAADKTAA